MNTIRMDMSERAFLVIYRILMNVKLGNRNHFEKALSDLMINMDSYGAEEHYNFLADNIGEPKLSFEFSDNDGFVINVSDN